MSAFRDEWPLPAQSENRVREHSVQEDESLNFSSQEAETFLGHSGGNVQEVDACPERSFGEAASHTWQLSAPGQASSPREREEETQTAP